jgi:hypothetical protein
MSSRDFVYWLMGFFELRGVGNDSALTSEQVRCIQAHLAMVFKHEIDPSYGDTPHQAALSVLHSMGVAPPDRPTETKPTPASPGPAVYPFRC